MAKSRTGRQRAASKRNIKKAQIASARKRRLTKKGVLKGVAIGAVFAGSAITARKVYNRNHVYLYHSTSKEAHRNIKKNGFRKGHDYTGDGGDSVYFSTKHQKNYGDAVIKLRVRKSDFKKHARRDPLAMLGHENYYVFGVRQANRFLRGK